MKKTSSDLVVTIFKQEKLTWSAAIFSAVIHNKGKKLVQFWSEFRSRNEIGLVLLSDSSFSTQTWFKSVQNIYLSVWGSMRSSCGPNEGGGFLFFVTWSWPCLGPRCGSALFGIQNAANNWQHKKTRPIVYSRSRCVYGSWNNQIIICTAERLAWLFMILAVSCLGIRL